MRFTQPAAPRPLIRLRRLLRLLRRPEILLRRQVHRLLQGLIRVSLQVILQPLLIVQVGRLPLIQVNQRRLAIRPPITQVDQLVGQRAEVGQVILIAAPIFGL